MIDDELLQELLAKASGLYNNGDYRGAITAWKEALGVDPSSQKAREGIQMATLLLADWDPLEEAASPASESPADGPPPAQHRLTPEQRSARLDQGVARVRSLLRDRKYSDALEGAKGLIPIDPDSEEVQRLVEDAQQAFESAPFIDEHLVLARELAAQERLDEAEAECQKVFTLDPSNPDARALAAELRIRRDAPQAPADAGGVTMRMEVADLLAAHTRGAERSPSPGAGRQEPEAGEDRLDALDASDDAETFVLDAGEGPPDPGPAAGQEPVASIPEADEEPQSVAPEPALSVADTLPDDLLEMDPGVESPVAPDAPASGAAASGDAPPDETMELLDLEAPPDLAGLEMDAEQPAATDPAAAASSAVPPDTAEPPAEDTILDAETVVPPAVRLVPRTEEPPASIESILEAAEGVESIPLATPPPPAPSRSGVAAKPAKQVSWEEELESLNIKSGQHDLVGRSAARNTTPAGPAGDEMDLSALLGDEIGDMGQTSGGDTGGADPEGPSMPAAPSAAPRAAAASPVPVDDITAGIRREALTREEPPAVEPQREFRKAPRKVAPVVSHPPRERRAIPPMLFALLGIVILAGAAAYWWFVYQPRIAAAQVSAPPAGGPPADAESSRHRRAPIPTPLGSTSRNQGQPPGPDEGVAAAGAAPAPEVQPKEATAPETIAPPTAAPAAPPSAPAPAPAPRSPEELRRQAAAHLETGRRLADAGKWQDARAQLAAALALDPVNFEVKELLDKVQAKVDEETKVTRDLDEARRSFADKDYQAALWKLYRLPRDPRLGNIELYIRNAWFNWAVVGMKGGDATDARQKLGEVLSADPDDAAAQTMLEVAERYSSRAKDRLYYSFVDTLRFRAFDQK